MCDSRHTENCRNTPVPKLPWCLFCRLWICWGFLNILYKHDSSDVSKVKDIGASETLRKTVGENESLFSCYWLLVFIMSKVFIFLSKHKNQQQNPESSAFILKEISLLKHCQDVSSNIKFTKILKSQSVPGGFWRRVVRCLKSSACADVSLS